MRANPFPFSGKTISSPRRKISASLPFSRNSFGGQLDYCRTEKSEPSPFEFLEYIHRRYTTWNAEMRVLRARTIRSPPRKTWGPRRRVGKKQLARDADWASLVGLPGFVHSQDARRGAWDDCESALGKEAARGVEESIIVASADAGCRDLPHLVVSAPAIDASAGCDDCNIAIGRTSRRSLAHPDDRADL